MSHKKPVSRRDFLASGLLSSAAMVMAPSLLSMLASRRAFGADACGPTGVITPRTPFICIDLAGGANIAGSNFIVGKQGGQLDYLTAYTKLGLVAAAHPKNAGQVNQEFGIAMHADSAMLRGMISVTSPATRSRVEGVIIPVQAGDDTSNNGHNPIYWISKAGLRGSVAPLAGTTSGGSGGNSKAPASSMDPTLRPVRIGRAADGPELINLGRLSSAFSPAKVDRIMKVIQNLSASHLNAFAEKDLPSQFRTLVDCGYTRATGLATSGGADALDPRLDAQVLAVFPNVGTLSVSEQQTATIAKLVLDGYVGAGTIAKGGYDYHDNTRSTGERSDFLAGQAIGQCLELASRKGKDLMIYLYTDGGVFSDEATIDNSADGRGKLVWRGDSGDRSCTVMLLYRHAGKPSILKPGRQIGYFRDNGQGVDLASSLVARNVETLSSAVVLNYLALDGRIADFTKVVNGTNPFAGKESDYTFFDRIA